MSGPTGDVAAPSAPELQTPVTGKRRSMLVFIAAFARAQGYPPTMREIGDGCAIRSTSDVSLKLTQLEDAGFLQAPSGRRAVRSFALTAAGRQAIGQAERRAVRCPACGERFEVAK